MKRIFALLLAVAAVSMPAWGCGEAEELVNCSQVCQAKRDCVEDAYDVDRCTDECEAKSDLDDEYRRQIRDCEACIDERACVEQVACFDRCPSLP